MLRNLNTTRDGKRICGLPTEGVLGSTIPTVGEGGRAALLANDVAFNSLYTNEVRLWITNHNFPGSFFVDEYSRWEATDLVDGTYNASGILIVDGVDADVASVVLWLTVGSATGTAVSLTPSAMLITVRGGSAILTTATGSVSLAPNANSVLVSGQISSITLVGAAGLSPSAALIAVSGQISSLTTSTDGAFVPSWRVPAGSLRQGGVSNNKITQKRTTESVVFDIDCLSMIGGLSIAGFGSASSEPLGLTFSSIRTNPYQVTYPDGAVVLPGKIAQVCISGGTIPNHAIYNDYLVVIPFTTPNQSELLEAVFTLRIRDTL